MGIRVLIKRKEEKENEEHSELHTSDEEEKRKRSRLALILAIPVLAIVAFIVFFLTQDMSLKMILIDWWTLAHAILFAGGILSYIFAYRKEKGGDHEDDQPAGDTHTSAA